MRQIDGITGRLTGMDAGALCRFGEAPLAGLPRELKVPLADNGSHPFALGVTTGSTVGVGLDASFERPSERPPGEGGEGGGRGRGGYGGRQGGFGGRGGGRRGGGGGSQQSERPQSFETWAKVNLATAEQKAQ